jgi:amino acid transporter
MSSATGALVRWPWIVTIAALALVNFLVWETGAGQCVDYTAESGLISTCTSGPAVGWAGAWGISGVSVLIVAYCIYRLARRRSSN